MLKTENGPTSQTAGLAKKVSKTMAKTRTPLRTSELNGNLENLDIELVDPSSPIRANFDTENATKEATALNQGPC